MIDFTLKIYSELLVAIKRIGYECYTFEDWCEGKAKGRFVILRHDVDLRAGHSLATATIEAQLGIRASYYFRVVAESNVPDVIMKIAALGHEIGYHYEDLSLFKGDTVLAIAHFEQQLTYFRQFYPVKTVCMHGSPASKFDNKELWKLYNYRDYGIVGEPYFDFLNGEVSTNNVLYLTDTARMWDGDKYNVRDKRVSNDEGRMANDELRISNDELILPKIHSTQDFIDWLATNPTHDVMMITTHPQRWTDSRIEWVQELVMQSLKNVVKRWMFVK